MQRQLLFLFIWFVPMLTHAEITLPAIFSDHMVMQQNTVGKIWGWAAPKDRITVICSWLPAQEFKTFSNPATLRWEVNFPTPAASMEPHTIVIKGGWTDIQLTDILFGEVWICSGQSNMEWQPAWGNVTVSNAQLNAANDKGLRYFSVPRTASAVAETRVKGEWLVSSRDRMPYFSATAYFFGRELRDRLGIPVGLVHASWGGTPIESWMPDTCFAPEKPLAQVICDDHPVWRYGRPGAQWNGMIAPLQGLKIKGFIWYQGETNTFNPPDYPALMKMLVQEWRRAFGSDTLPFYFVQIAPWQYGVPQEGAALREAQLKAFRTIAHSGMAVISDIGDPLDIHPANKTDVGKRLAAWALAHTYRLPLHPGCGPLYRTHTVEDNKIRIFFDYSAEGLQHDGNNLEGFVVAGVNREFVPAQAVIQGTEVMVWADQIASPEAVRYGFHNVAAGNLTNSVGLPASTFRTDNWPVFWPETRFNILAPLPDGGFELEVASPDPRYTVQCRWEEHGVFQPVFQPVVVKPGMVLEARIIDPHGNPSDRVDSFGLVVHRGFGKTIWAASQAHADYSGINGSNSIVDGLYGKADITHPAWQGYDAGSPEWIIDLGEASLVQSVKSGFLNATVNGVFPPLTWEVEYSRDGKKYRSAGVQKIEIPEKHTAASIWRTEIQVNQEARFLRIKAKNRGKCPAWHQMPGQPAWIFVDEIEVYGL